MESVSLCNRRRFIKTLIAFMLCCFCGAVFAKPEVGVFTRNVEIAIHNAAFTTSDSAYTINDVSHETYHDKWLSLDKFDDLTIADVDTFWVRFEVTVGEVDPHIDWVLFNGGTMHSHIQTYTHDITNDTWNNSRPTGLNYKLKERYYQNQFFEFPLQLKSNHRYVVYQQIRSENLLYLPIGILTEVELFSTITTQYIYFGGFFGAMLIMLCYSTALYALVKQKDFFYFSLYLGTIVLFELSVTGLDAFIWDSFTWLKLKGDFFFGALSMLASVLFTRHFLHLHRWPSWTQKINSALIVYWVSLASCMVMPIDADWMSMMNNGVILTIIVGFILSIYLWDKNEPLIKTYALAWIAPILGTTVFMLMVNGKLPSNSFTMNSQMLSLVVQMLIFSYALASRINDEKLKHEESQRDALDLTKRVSEERRERLKAQMETLTVQKQLTENLEKQVQDRTSQLEDAMQKLEAANTELKELSNTDPLTAVHNRRYFDDTLIDEYKRAHRSKQTIAVIMADIDYFKRINDNLGHHAGDECIRKVAHALENIVNRPGDLVSRYGGEEFVYLLPGSSLENAMKIAEAARIAIEHLDIEVQGKKIPLTISAGVAAWIPATDHGYKELMAAADNALYQAKRAGRNCIVASKNSGITPSDNVLARMQ